jgi:flavorubredoxin
LPRELAPGIHWIGACISVAKGTDVFHSHFSAFVIVGESATLLIDTGNPDHWKTVESQLDAVLAGRQLDFVVPTHPELPHGGNLARLFRKYPYLQLVGDIRDWPRILPASRDRMVPMGEGTEIALGGGYQFVFLPALIKDLPAGQSGYERKTNTMFVGDGLGYIHPPPDVPNDVDALVHVDGECALLTSELPTPQALEHAQILTCVTLYSSRLHGPGPICETGSAAVPCR